MRHAEDATADAKECSVATVPAADPLRELRDESPCRPNGPHASLQVIDRFQRKIWLRNSLVRSCCGLSKNGSGAFISTISPLSIKDDSVGDLPSKAHLVGHNDHGHAVLGERCHRIQHFLYHFGIER